MDTSFYVCRLSVDFHIVGRVISMQDDIKAYTYFVCGYHLFPLMHTHTQTEVIYIFITVLCLCSPNWYCLCVINWVLVQTNVICPVQWGRCGRLLVYGCFEGVCLCVYIFVSMYSLKPRALTIQLGGELLSLYPQEEQRWYTATPSTTC